MALILSGSVAISYGDPSKSTKYPSAIPNPAIVLEGDKYPDIARIIDVVAFLVLASGLFVPIARAGLRMMHLVDTDVALIFAGAAL